MKLLVQTIIYHCKGYTLFFVWLLLAMILLILTTGFADVTKQWVLLEGSSGALIRNVLSLSVQSDESQTNIVFRLFEGTDNVSEFKRHGNTVHFRLTDWSKSKFQPLSIEIIANSHLVCIVMVQCEEERPVCSWKVSNHIDTISNQFLVDIPKLSLTFARIRGNVALDHYRCII